MPSSSLSVQESLLPREHLVDTPFGLKGYTSDYTVMEEDLPRASMEPDPEAVERIKEDPDKLQVKYLFLLSVRLKQRCYPCKNFKS